MKKVTFTFLMLIFGASLFAQGIAKDKATTEKERTEQRALPLEERAKRQTDKMTRAYGLTREQSVQVYELNVNRLRHLYVMQEHANVPQQDMQERRRTIAEEYNGQVRSI